MKDKVEENNVPESYRWFKIKPGCVSILTITNTAKFILAGIKKYGRITVSEISESLNIPQTYAYKTVTALRRAGYLKRSASNKTPEWEVVGDFNFDDTISLPDIINQAKENQTRTRKPSTIKCEIANKIIELLSKNKYATLVTMGEHVGCSPSVAYKYIRALYVLGILRRVGSSKDGYWEIKEDAPKFTEDKIEVFLDKAPNWEEAEKGENEDPNKICILIKCKIANKVLDFVAKTKNVSLSTLSAYLGKSESVAYKYLRALVALGNIERVGGIQKGCWKVNKNVPKLAGEAVNVYINKSSNTKQEDNPKAPDKGKTSASKKKQTAKSKAKPKAK